MKKALNLLFLATLVFALSSCESRRRGLVIETVKKFHNLHKEDKYSECKKIYPNIAVLDGYSYKTDEFLVKGVCKKEDEFEEEFYIVFCENKWTNNYGKTFINEIRFYLKENDNEEVPYLIFDSKNFITPENKINEFALKIGAISERDSTDVLKSAKFKDAKDFFQGIKDRLRTAIKNGLSYNINWSLDGYYSNYASGRCTITNNSDYAVKNLRYTINYRRSKNGNIVATDDGVVTYGWFYPNESKSVSWFTDHLPNGIHWCEIHPVFDEDDDWVEEVVMSMPLEGFYGEYLEELKK